MSERETRIERFGLFKVEQPVGQQWWDNPAPQANREHHWGKVADIMEAEREREARDERRATYYRELLQHDSLGEAFQKAVA